MARRHLIAPNDGEDRSTDDWLGRLFDVLREIDVWQDTAVIVTADHGEEFFEHGKKGHRKSLYDEVVHVPLVMRHPWKAWRGRRGEVTRSIDIYPTVLELAGIEPVRGIRRDPDPMATRPVRP
jgi:arylsulfatase A-like enzyme